jgi:exodeoxyribonuclease V beta subunit
MSESIHPAQALRLQGRCLIEASAGTGKTWSIAKLFVRALLEKKLLPNQVLVVTFTNAATKELSERLYLELLDVENWLLQCVQEQSIAKNSMAEHSFYHQWATNFFDPNNNADFNAKEQLAWIKRCIHRFDEAAISTLQGFCEGVVKRHSTEMGIELVASAFDVNASSIGQGSRAPSESSNGVIVEVAAVFGDEVNAINALPFHEAAFLKAAVGKFSDLLESVKSLLNKPAILPSLSDQPLAEQRKSLLGFDILKASANFTHAVNQKNIDDFVAYGNRYMANLDRHKSIKSRQFNDLILALKDLAANGAMDSKDWARLKRVSAAGQIGKSKIGANDSLSDLELVKQARVYFEHYFAFDERADGYRQQLVLRAFYAAKKALLDGNNLSFANTPLSYTRTVQLAAQGLTSYPLVASQLQRRFPVALIDEFQDTDPTQAIILNAIYPEPSGNESVHHRFAVVMVGDPKQAIYNFRGADVYAYLKAKKSVQQVFSLDTNQRSVAPLVDEVNSLFAALPSVFDVPGIDFVAMKASGKHSTSLKPPSCRYVLIPESKSGFDVWHWVAVEIHKLLATGCSAQDVAVLVSSHKNAGLMREALSALGLQARAEDKTSIWALPIASYLLWFLQGVLRYTDSPALKKALLTPLGSQICSRLFSAEQLQDLKLIRAVNDTLLSEFARLKGLWLSSGFAAFWQEAFPNPETDPDLRHLLELINLSVPLQVLAPHDMFGLVQWLEAQVNKSSRAALSEDANRRRSVASGFQVQISTIHASKGLQYEVVFLPDLVGRADPRAGRITYFEKGMQLAADLSASEFQSLEVTAASEREQEREELRLAYVALTRAVQACYLLVPSDLAAPPAKKAKKDRRLTAMVRARLMSLQAAGSDALSYAERVEKSQEEQPLFEETLSADVATSVGLLPLLELPRAQTSQAWVIDSFTALARRSANENHTLSSTDSFGYIEQSAQPVGKKLSQSLIEFEPHFGHDIQALPKGARTGECLHAILENTRWLDGLTVGSNFSELQKQASRYDIAVGKFSELAQWLDDVLKTPLINDFCLRDIAPEKMIREWRFDNLQEKLGSGKSSAYSSAYLRGYVDLVFEHQNKFYIVDYKSNWLGADDDAYLPESIAVSMREHQYDLQAKIYAAALKNFLASRLGANNVSTVYGGVLYLYLRAMKSSAPGFGVFHVA